MPEGIRCGVVSPDDATRILNTAGTGDEAGADDDGMASKLPPPPEEGERIESSVLQLPNPVH